MSPKTQADLPETFLRFFNPESWKSVDKVKSFHCKEVQDTYLFERGIKTTSDHLNKYFVLADICNDLIPKLDIDIKEFEDNSYTKNTYSKKFAAVAECCINELYSSLDGIRDVIFSIYKNMRGVQKKKTGKLFKNAKENIYEDNFPKELKDLLAKAYDNWFLGLRKHRTELTHGSLGSCHKDKETEKIMYFHEGMGTATRSLIIEDFIDYINKTHLNCMKLQEDIFDYLYNTLPLMPTECMCGIYKGLAFARIIHPENNLNVDSGYCISVDRDIPCPIRNTCGAYLRATTENNHEK